MILTGIGDEGANGIDGQIQAAQELGWRFFEIRGVALAARIVMITFLSKTMMIAAVVSGACAVANAAETRMIPVTQLNGVAYVPAAELERSAGIAIKSLPGSDAVAACSEARCARLKGFLREGDVTLVSLGELQKALGLVARFSEDRRQVHLTSEAKSLIPDGSITRVGDLAPNFRMARLDGTPVSLADFRGKRVLIQSWASW